MFWKELRYADMIRDKDLNGQYENIWDEINERNKTKSTSDRLIL